MRRFARMFTLVVLVGTGALAIPHAQGQDPAPRPIGPDEWPTFKAGTRLATIDAVVVDADGRHVTDLRVFKPGSDVAYTCEIYDGRGEPPPLASATLLRDGQPIFTSAPAPVTATGRERTAVRAVPVGGRLNIGRRLSPGRYTLQVTVARGDAPTRPHASQWTEFEVR